MTMKKQKTYLILVALMLVLAILACGLPSIGDDQSQLDGGQDNTTSEEWTSEDLMEIGNFDQLESYRMTMEITEKDAEGNPLSSMVVVIEKDNPNNATHTVISDQDGNTFLETIVIGDTTWMKMPFSEDWIQSPPSEEDDFYSETPFGSDNWGEVVGDYGTTLRDEGRDNMNGVRCRKYYIQHTDDVEGSTIESEGYFWVADQIGLPKIMVRSEFTTETTDSTGKITYGDFIIDITYINEQITIEPPQ